MTFGYDCLVGTTTASTGGKAEEKTEQAKKFTQEAAEQAKQKGNQVRYRCSTQYTSVADILDHTGCC
jgi:hypothetical protein